MSNGSAPQSSAPQWESRGSSCSSPSLPTVNQNIGYNQALAPINTSAVNPFYSSDNSSVKIDEEPASSERFVDGNLELSAGAKPFVPKFYAPNLSSSNLAAPARSNRSSASNISSDMSPWNNSSSSEVHLGLGIDMTIGDVTGLTIGENTSIANILSSNASQSTASWPLSGNESFLGDFPPINQALGITDDKHSIIPQSSRGESNAITCQIGRSAYDASIDDSFDDDITNLLSFKSISVDDPLDATDIGSHT
jgi:hypothetical protein